MQRAGTRTAALALLAALGACEGAVGQSAGDGGLADAPATDASGDAVAPDAAPDAVPPSSCDFDYDDVFTYALPPSPPAAPAPAPQAEPPGPDMIAHAEPPPPGYRRVPRADARYRDIGDIVLPTYEDTMPRFPRAEAWTGPRCYETPAGVLLLTEPEAFEMYRAIAELTTGVAMDTSPEVRTVVGIRGAYPGRIAFHGNLPNRFNDTLVLLWIDAAAAPHVREFPVNTDTGAYDFGTDASSSLRPNRRYRYVNGWHRDYNALHIDEIDYLVRDDTNHNGHWDSDRNGWLPPSTGDDHDRTGGGHNIHMGSVDAPLGSAAVDNWSAGCQVIPGMANWLEFITNAWTTEGDPVNYFLVDVRDIDPEVWQPCAQADGSHACPFVVDGFPFSATGDTRSATARDFDLYNCSTADESGAEIVYLLTVDRSGTLSVAVDDVTGDAVDVDVHLLDADSPLACLARADVSFSRAIGPGRYYVVVDTYVASGVEMPGPYRLDVDFN